MKVDKTRSCSAVLFTLVLLLATSVLTGCGKKSDPLKEAYKRCVQQEVNGIMSRAPVASSSAARMDEVTRIAVESNCQAMGEACVRKNKQKCTAFLSRYGAPNH